VKKRPRPSFQLSLAALAADLVRERQEAQRREKNIICQDRLGTTKWSDRKTQKPHGVSSSQTEIFNFGFSGNGAKNATFCAIYIYNNGYFTKTGSGQT
jgi:hypothetical protein